MRAALEASIASGTVQLWTTTETFQAAVTGTESANGWQPAPVSRIRQQIAAEAPYVSQIIQFMYGWDMSPEATYTPVEADTLLAQYSREGSGATSLATGGGLLQHLSFVEAIRISSRRSSQTARAADSGNRSQRIGWGSRAIPREPLR
jgi:hypothetical protein